MSQSGRRSSRPKEKRRGEYEMRSKSCGIVVKGRYTGIQKVRDAQMEYPS